MANRRATTYMAAKNSTGCKAPIVLNDLDFIQLDFLVFPDWPGLFFSRIFTSGSTLLY